MFTSLFGYDEHMVEYLHEHGTSAGYDGPVYGHYAVIDFDGQDLAQTTNALIPLIVRLEELEIDYLLFYSGNKGYHLYVPKEYFEYPDGGESSWNLVCRGFAQWVVDEFTELTPYVDFNIYDKLRIFRYPFSIHGRSNREKFLLRFKGMDCDVASPVQRFERLACNPDDVLAKVFQGYPVDTESDHFQVLATLRLEERITPASVQVAATPQTAEVFDFPYDEKHCIYSMLREPNLRGRRHTVGLRLQSYWREKGYTPVFIENLMRTWNASLAEPLAEEELQNILQYRDRYTFTCADSLKRMFCDRSCMYHRAREVETEHIFIGDRYAEAYHEALIADQTNWIRLDQIYPELTISPIKPDRGHVTVICAGSGVGKTTFAMNLMVNVRHINWLFLSYEMSGDDIAEKFWNMAGFAGEPITQNRRAQYNDMIKHIVTIDNPGHIDNLEAIVRMVRARHGIDCKGVVLDYLQMIPSRGEIAIEQARHISKKLKEVSKRLGIAPFILSQVPKELAGDGNLPLPLQSPKDSGEITNLADKQIGLWRPNINRRNQGIDDNLMTFNLAKDRHGPGGCTSDLPFNGRRGIVSSVIRQSYGQAA